MASRCASRPSPLRFFNSLLVLTVRFWRAREAGGVFIAEPAIYFSVDSFVLE
jgi:hypothetical protein